MTTDDIMALANKYAASNGKALLEKIYGTSQSYTEQCTAEAFQDRQSLRAAIETLRYEVAAIAAIKEERDALQASLREAKKLLEAYAQVKAADEARMRQAVDALAYWLEHGETPGSHDIIQRTHDALQERLK